MSSLPHPHSLSPSYFSLQIGQVHLCTEAVILCAIFHAIMAGMAMEASLVYLQLSTLKERPLIGLCTTDESCSEATGINFDLLLYY